MANLTQQPERPVTEQNARRPARLHRTLAYTAAGFIIAYAFSIGLAADFPDTRAYYDAAHGDLSHTVTWKEGRVFVSGWIYVDIVQYLWYWMRLFPREVDTILWFVIQSVSFLYLTHRLIKEAGRYAWIILASLWWPIGWFLSGSNVSVTLLACVLNPWLAAMACLVKPYLIVFLLLHLWVESRAMVHAKAV
jgi:hypothetical protein